MKAEGGRILVVDDDASLCETLEIVLRRAGHEVSVARSAREALARLDDRSVELVLTDVRMPGSDGIELLGEIRKRSADVIVIVMTAFSTWNQAVEAMRLGAFDYVRKPFDNNEDLLATVARGIRLARDGSAKSRGGDFEGMIVGHSEAMRDLRGLIRRVAPTDSTVLIQGESGTGKELVARALHEGSLRAAAPFVSVNCGAFTETLLESEMFGHVKGAFTGAVGDKKGLVEVADTGALFLDEVGEMSAALQVKLLRTLEEREYTPVGSTKPRKVDVRFIAATNRNLDEEVRKGRFREDLYYRLNVIPIRLAPLRERKGDIPLLVGRFLSTYAKPLRSKARRLSEEAMEILMRYDWPGNVRELENAVQRAVALCDGELIGPEALDERIVKGSRRFVAGQAGGEGGISIPEEGVRLEEILGALEKRYIEAALLRTEGNLTKASRLLGITIWALRNRMRKLDIQKTYKGPE